MKDVQPKVYLVARPSLDRRGVSDYLDSVGGEDWLDNREGYAIEDGIEFAGRLCYRSWKPGLNENVTRVRDDQGEYIKNILASGHGSVLEHGMFSFVFENVSRVFTHELVRHRVGVGISQESMRFVRFTDIPMWLPPFLADNRDVVDPLIAHVEEAVAKLIMRAQLDTLSFSEKKKATSAIRRLIPDGVATVIEWSANIRTLRHCLEMRTDKAAEEEIRLVFDEVGKIMQVEAPLLFADYIRDASGAWTTPYRKV